jgi:arylsulfatase A-like enzyme
MVGNYDFLPTVLRYLNLGDKLKDARPKSPGRDFSPILHSKPLDWENVVYYEMEFVRAIRTDRWKYVHRPEGPYELYDLTGDPYEKFNLYGQPQHVAIQGDLKSRLDTFFDKTAEPKYNLYRGGTSKATLLSARSG